MYSCQCATAAWYGCLIAEEHLVHGDLITGAGLLIVVAIVVIAVTIQEVFVIPSKYLLLKKVIIRPLKITFSALILGTLEKSRI